MKRVVRWREPRLAGSTRSPTIVRNELRAVGLAWRDVDESDARANGDTP
jgi:hypothetical protein